MKIIRKNPILASALTSKAKTLESARALVVDDQIIGRSLDLPSTRPPSSSDDDESTIRTVYSVADCVASPGIPKQPPIIKLTEQLSLTVGVYIMTAATGVGKSILGATLCALGNAVNVPSSYLPHFEPRVPPYKQKSAGSTVFSRSGAYVSDLRDLLEKAGKRTKLVVCDSATLPLKAYSVTMPGQSTFPGGMQISDRAFLDAISLIAAQTDTVIVLILNETLIPYVSDLYGAVEGHIAVTGPDRLTVSDRSSTSARAEQTVTLPSAYVNATTVAFGYGRFKSSRSYTSNREVRGFTETFGQPKVK